MMIVDCIRRNEIQSARLRDDAMWSRRREKNSEQLGRAGKECMSNTMMAAKLQNICTYMQTIHIDAQKMSSSTKKRVQSTERGLTRLEHAFPSYTLVRSTEAYALEGTSVAEL